MKLNLYACLSVGALVFATQALADPQHPGTVFLAVDINGANTAGGQSPGPTQSGYQGWDVLAITDVFDANYGAANNWTAFAPTGMSLSFATGQGNIGATLSGNGTSYRPESRCERWWNSRRVPGLRFLTTRHCDRLWTIFRQDQIDRIDSEPNLRVYGPCS